MEGLRLSTDLEDTRQIVVTTMKWTKEHGIDAIKKQLGNSSRDLDLLDILTETVVVFP
jgi:hypothetical protein